MTNDELYDAALLELAAIERGISPVKLMSGEPLIGAVHCHSSIGWTVACIQRRGGMG